MGEMTRLIYIDDSGNADYGLIVYGWVEVSPEAWRRGLRAWLNLRRELFRDYTIHVSTELHCTKYIQGRGSLTSVPPARFVAGDTGAVDWRRLGREVAGRCLATLQSCPEIQVGAVYRNTTAKGRDYHEEKHQVYRILVRDLDVELRAADSYGFITMDGDDPRYRDAHRDLRLDARHLIEDPAYHDSRHSQWTQMADLVAYTVNLHLNRHEGNKFGWSWYQDYLGSCGTLTEV
ncbi:MAG: DUF3800 domain-containing protein [Actinomycetota bacterium]|nr:DUF3800 domain-containing protein [Actinomycetota bacterium]